MNKFRNKLFKNELGPYAFYDNLLKYELNNNSEKTLEE